MLKFISNINSAAYVGGEWQVEIYGLEHTRSVDRTSDSEVKMAFMALARVIYSNENISLCCIIVLNLYSHKFTWAGAPVAFEI